MYIAIKKYICQVYLKCAPFFASPAVPTCSPTAPSRVEPSRAEPSRAEPSPAELSPEEPKNFGDQRWGGVKTHTNTMFYKVYASMETSGGSGHRSSPPAPGRTDPSQAEPSRARLSPAQLSPGQPSPAELSPAQPSPARQLAPLVRSVRHPPAGCETPLFQPGCLQIQCCKPIW